MMIIICINIVLFSVLIHKRIAWKNPHNPLHLFHIIKVLMNYLILSNERTNFSSFLIPLKARNERIIDTKG